MIFHRMEKKIKGRIATVARVETFGLSYTDFA